MDKQIYTVKGIAAQIGASERAVRQAIKRVELPGKKICGKGMTTATVFNEFMRVEAQLKYDRATN